MFSNVTLALILLLVAVPDRSDLIDLTVVVPKARRLEPATSSASGGLVGYGDEDAAPTERRPIEFRIISARRSGEFPKAYLTYEVSLTNISGDKFIIPVDPHPADVEPASGAPYVFTRMYFSPTIQAGGDRYSLQGVAVYGTADVPKTLRSLAPGESIRIRGRSRLMSLDGSSQRSPDTMQRTAVCKMFLSLSTERVSQRGADLHEESVPVVGQVESSNVVTFSLAGVENRN